MTDDLIRFDRIFVVEPSHDVSVLSKYASQLVFIGSSEDKIEDLISKIYQNISSFNPETDAIIPMGRVSSCLISGLFLSKLLYEKFSGAYSPRTIWIGIYRGDQYLFIPMEVT